MNSNKVLIFCLQLLLSFCFMIRNGICNEDFPGMPEIPNITILQVEELIENKTDLDLPYEGYSLLITSVLKNQEDIAELLLENGADVNLEFTLGITPLHIATFQTNLPLIKLLISYGADIDAEHDNGITPLSSSLMTGETNIVCQLVESGADVNHVSRNGNIPLSYACLSVSTNKNNIIRFLLNKGADPNNGNPVDGDTPLAVAVASGQLDLIEILLEANATIDLDHMHMGQTMQERAACWDVICKTNRFSEILEEYLMLQSLPDQEGVQ